MNWYKDKIQEEFFALENKLRKNYIFLQRKDIDEDLKKIVLDSHKKMLERYNELKIKVNN